MSEQVRRKGSKKIQRFHVEGSRKRNGQIGNTDERRRGGVGLREPICTRCGKRLLDVDVIRICGRGLIVQRQQTEQDTTKRAEGGLHSRNTLNLVQIGGKEEENRKRREKEKGELRVRTKRYGSRRGERWMD
jgi:hypothetical protein